MNSSSVPLRFVGRSPNGALSAHDTSVEPPAPGALRLAIGRRGIAIELAASAPIGCLNVVEATTSIAGLKFPLDVSGGVARFRHRRGQLETLGVEVESERLRAWAKTRLRGVVGPSAPDIWVAVRPNGGTFAVSDRSVASAPRLLAFDFLVEISGDFARIFVMSARGAGLPQPPSMLAIQALAALFGSIATRHGAAFAFEHAIDRIVDHVMPDSGMRIPDTDHVRMSALTAHSSTWIVHATRGGAPASVDEATLHAREACALMELGDNARAAGDLVRARELDMAALERAPQHRAIAVRIAEIDALAGGRAEAALATLRDAKALDSARLLAAELLVETGDIAGAIARFSDAGEYEQTPDLAAHAFKRAADLSENRFDALEWLNRALARAPSAVDLRWQRITMLLAIGRNDDALADVEQIEAATRGARAKHEVWRRAGEAWRKVGAATEAAAIFERALKFVPDEPESLAGLGAALIAEQKAARGVALLYRAIELAEADSGPTSGMVLELARALAEHLGDKPAAIARARSIAATAPEAVEARSLEGRWRNDIGDIAGATLAYARMREQIATAARPDDDDVIAIYVTMLLEAASFEKLSAYDLRSAERHLAEALRIAPHDASVQGAFRDVCAEIAFARHAPPGVGDGAGSARGSRLARGEVTYEAEREEESEDFVGNGTTAGDRNDVVAIRESSATVIEASVIEAIDFGVDDTGDVSLSDTARVEVLTAKIRANPNDDAAVDELAELLEQLGRGHELLALLMSRLEDATAERRAELVPKTQDAMKRLEASAEKAGRMVEAGLYRDARSMI